MQYFKCPSATDMVMLLTFRRFRFRKENQISSVSLQVGVGVAIGTYAALRQRVVTPNIVLSLNIDLI